MDAPATPAATPAAIPTADDARKAPVLIYAPGLGRYHANTGGGVAEALAGTLSRRVDGDYDAADLKGVTAPRGLRLGKTLVHPNGTVVLQVFELDYRPKLDPLAGPTGPPTPPGAVRSTMYAVGGVFTMLKAFRSPAKGGKAKFQLGYALFFAVVLAFSAITAAAGALVAIVPGDWLPDGVQNALDSIAVPAGVVAVGGWAVFRRKLLAISASVQRNLRYLNDGRHRDTVALTLDDAVDGLRQSGWTGPLHVLGYSFGSLVAIDALLPLASHPSVNPRIGGNVATLTTVGCPFDFVRLFKRGYGGQRESRVDGLSWVNVFIPADVLASNLQDGKDDNATDSPKTIGGVTPDVRQYGDDQLELIKVFTAKGLRTHGGYWGGPDEASCFDMLLDRWITTT